MAIVVRDVEKLNTWLPALNSVCRLTPETTTKSPYEELFKKYLLQLGITSSYEPFSLLGSVKGIGPMTYTPDFVTSQLKVNGRFVAIEPHMMYNHSDVKLRNILMKLNMFRNRAGRMFFLIIVSDIGLPMLGSRAGINPSQSFDDYWHIPTIHSWSSISGRTAETEVKSMLEGLKSRPECMHLKNAARR